MKRAYYTAIPIADKLKIKIIKNKIFREIYAGKWQEQSFEYIKKQYFDDYSVWLNDIGNACCTDGESVRQLSERVVNAIKILSENEKEKTIVISTHATPIRAFQTVCEKGDISFAKDVVWTANASVTVCEYTNGNFNFKLSGYNEFLADLKSTFPSSVV